MLHPKIWQNHSTMMMKDLFYNLLAKQRITIIIQLFMERLKLVGVRLIELLISISKCNLFHVFFYKIVMSLGKSTKCNNVCLQDPRPPILTIKIINFLLSVISFHSFKSKKIKICIILVFWFG